MKGIDTNVLVRVLVEDDIEQTEQASAYVARNAPCWVNRIVLCEAVWVLQRLYRFDRPQIAAALKKVLRARHFEIEDPEAVKAGVAALEAGSDFADVVIAATNRARGCITIATFDKKAVRLEGFEAVQ